MRIFKSAMKVLAFGLLILLVNEMFRFALEPMRGASDVMWSDYEKEENLNMIYTGSSFCLRSFNPYVIDDILGTESYNMGTPAQAINQTYVAIKTAIAEHDLDTIVLAVNYSSLESDWPEGAKVTFMQAKRNNESFGERVKDTVSFMFDKENRNECTSVNFLFPWIYNHVSIDRQSVLNNIRAKMSGEEMQMGTEDPDSKYVGKGFGYYIGEIDCNTIGNKNSRTIYSNEFSASAFQTIEDIARLCAQNDVELIAVNAPRPVLDIVSYGPDYFVKYDRLKRLFGESGVAYYDFNLVKPEIMEMKDEYFIDVEHLNKEGADEFSAAFARFLQRRADGEDMQAYFYTQEEYLDSIDYITNIYFDAQILEEGISLKLHAYHGGGVDVEYEVSLWDAATDTYTVVREYSEVDECLYKPEVRGTYVFCVKAREFGKNVDYDRFYKMEIDYE